MQVEYTTDTGDTANLTTIQLDGCWAVKDSIDGIFWPDDELCGEEEAMAACQRGDGKWHN